MILRIKFDNGLSYEMNLTRPVGADEKQVLLNRLENSTMNEFRKRMSAAFSVKKVSIFFWIKQNGQFITSNI